MNPETRADYATELRVLSRLSVQINTRIRELRGILRAFPKVVE